MAFFENWGIDKTHNILYNTTNKKRGNWKMKKFESLKKFKSKVVNKVKYNNTLLTTLDGVAMGASTGAYIATMPGIISGNLPIALGGVGLGAVAGGLIGALAYPKICEYHHENYPYDPIEYGKIANLYVGATIGWAAISTALMYFGGAFPDIISSASFGMITAPIAALPLTAATCFYNEWEFGLD